MKVIRWISASIITFVLAACSGGTVPNNPDTPEGDIAAQAGWQSLGGVIDATTSKSPLAVEMLLDRKEKPVVATLEDDTKGNYRVYFQKWTGTAWQVFAPSIISASSSSFDFQIDLKNRPVVAVTKNTRNGLEDFVYRYENSSWKQLGDPTNTPNVSPFIDLVIAPNGNIFALTSDDAANKSFIRRWNGATWQTDYTFQKTTTYQGETFTHKATSLTFTKTSRAVVTWQLSSEEWPYAATPEFYMEVWNDSAWVSLNAGGSWGEVILDKNDKVLEAFVGAQESSSISCGMSVWHDRVLLSGLKDATKSSSYALAVDSGNRPIVAHTVRCVSDENGWNDVPESQQDLVVRRWSGSKWQTLGGVVDRLTHRGASSVAFALDSKNVTYVLFTQCASSGSPCTNQNLYLSKYVP